MVTAAALRDEAAQLVMRPIQQNELINLANQLRTSVFPADQRQVIQEAFGYLELAHQRMIERDREVEQLEGLRDLFRDPDEGPNEGQIHPPELPEPRLALNLDAPPNLNPPLASAAIETGLFDRIWQAVKSALESFVEWILSNVFCLPPVHPSIQTPLNIQSRQSLQIPPVNLENLGDALIEPAILPIETIQGTTNWKMAGGRGMNENCPYAFLVAYWDHQKRGEGRWGVRELIDQSIRDAVNMNQHVDLYELFPRLRNIAIASNHEEPNYLTLIDRLEFAAAINQHQMAAGVIEKGADFYLILVDLRIEGKPKYFYFNPHAEPADLQISASKDLLIEFIDRSIDFKDLRIHRMEAFVIQDAE